MTRTSTPPQHGERRCYLRGCRRDECAAAHKRYCKQYRVATVHKPIRVDVQPVIARLANWTNLGYSQPQMAKATGVGLSDISKIVNGKHKTTHPDVAHRVLTAPDPTGVPFHATTDATGTIRRGRALHVMGYPIYQIAAEIPMHTYDLSRMLIDPPATVRLSVANGMTALCRRLLWAPGPSTIARRSAQRRAWRGPLDWDDIDDPTAAPEGTEAPTQTASTSKRIDVEHLLRFGVPTAEVMARTGASVAYVRDIAAELRTGKPRDRSRNKTAAAA